MRDKGTGRGVITDKNRKRRRKEAFSLASPKKS